ncbi:MAG: hypothetical protein COB36_05695 [Alphaproteobacteria bacterium]|nr:MAG: hypothetical protein COB36_05695 [Alphaproteobacteria bacterium]
MQGIRISSYLLYLFRVLLGMGAVLFFAWLVILISLHNQLYKDVGANIFFSEMYIFIMFITTLFGFFCNLGYANYVEDQNDSLLIKRRKTQEIIHLNDIKHIGYSAYSGCLILELVKESKFGSKIQFLPERKSFIKNNIFEDLKDRIYKAHIKNGT